MKHTRFLLEKTRRGGAAGLLVLHAPVCALGLAAGAAYATTRQVRGGSLLGRPWCWGQVAVPPKKRAHLDVPGRKWMDQMVNGSIGLFHLLINGVYWGHNPFTNNLLTSCDIQVGGGFIFFSFHPEPWGNDPI